MISFRYHIVSIVSLFLALAVGIALGGGPLQGGVDNTLVSQVQADRQTRTDLESEVTGLRSGTAFTDDFAKAVAPTVLGDTLRGRVVTVAVLPTAQQADVTALRDLVGVAGGSVGGTVRIGGKLVDAGAKQLVDELGSQLEGRAKDVDVPQDANAYERIGRLVGRAVGTARPGGDRVDGTATGILGGLEATKLLSVEGKLGRRGDLVLFVTGAGEGDQQQKQGAGSIVATLVESADAETAGVVLAGPVASARAGGQVKAVRDDVGAARDVSTVDSLDHTAGQVVTVMALAGQAAGRSGQYGAVDAADGPMPGARGGE